MTRLTFLSAKTPGNPGGLVVVASSGLGDTNFELGMPGVDPRRERMDDPGFQTDDARDFQDTSTMPDGGDKQSSTSKLFRRRAYIGGGETTITLKVRPGTENTLVPLLEDLQTLGSWGSSREILIDDFSDTPEKDGDGKHYFDGDGADKIIDIKVTKAKSKDALVHMHPTPPKGAPRENQRTHLDEDLKDELNPRHEDTDLVRHTTGVTAFDQALADGRRRATASLLRGLGLAGVGVMS